MVSRSPPSFAVAPDGVAPDAVPQRVLYTGARMPAIGLGTFLAQMFLRQPLIRAATQEFHIEGTWADPKIAKVARAPAASRAEVPAESKSGAGN